MAELCTVDHLDGGVADPHEHMPGEMRDPGPLPTNHRHCGGTAGHVHASAPSSDLDPVRVAARRVVALEPASVNRPDGVLVEAIRALGRALERGCYGA